MICRSSFQESIGHVNAVNDGVKDVNDGVNDVKVSCVFFLSYTGYLVLNFN